MILRILILLCVLTFNALSQKADLLFTTQNSYTSAASAGLGNAGIAVLSDISGGLVNPALVFSNGRSKSEPHGSISVGFGRDSVFNRYILPAGISYSTNEGALGLFYRTMSGKNRMDQHDITVNLSGQLFSESHGKGPVDFGVNFRYERFTWKNRSLEPLHTWQLTVDSAGNKQIKGTENIEPYSEKGTMSENRFLTDIGFFQKDAWNNIDFGLTLRNLFGYIRTEKNPVLFTIDSTDTVSADSAIEFRKENYENKTSKTKGWSQKQHRTVSIGTNYHINFENQVTLSIPMDLEIYGLLDKKTKKRFIFQCGIQVSISERFHIRGGYNRGPGDLIEDIAELEYKNIFTGGAGIDINPISFDFFLCKDHFGLNAVYHY
ncbi:MAG TPA: hypothetical protein VKY57_08715 [Chitinispirillaceae bacterium]|nr:hypothetical protein [Chitinispirillaceae bacterium]